MTQLVATLTKRGYVWSHFPLVFVADDGEIRTIGDVNTVSGIVLVGILKNGSIVDVHLATLTRLTAIEIDMLDAEAWEKMFALRTELRMS